ncbi:hypothetical protein M1563_00150 [Patescibacteria group bacterium]|nr:hypothetical protein [Patescibacteria group bacterium]
MDERLSKSEPQDSSNNSVADFLTELVAADPNLAGQYEAVANLITQLDPEVKPQTNPGKDLGKSLAKLVEIRAQVTALKDDKNSLPLLQAIDTQIAFAQARESTAHQNSANLINSKPTAQYSRRRFLEQLAGAAAIAGGIGIFVGGPVASTILWNQDQTAANKLASDQAQSIINRSCETNPNQDFCPQQVTPINEIISESQLDTNLKVAEAQKLKRSEIAQKLLPDYREQVFNRDYGATTPFRTAVRNWGWTPPLIAGGILFLGIMFS